MSARNIDCGIRVYAVNTGAPWGWTRGDLNLATSYINNVTISVGIYAVNVFIFDSAGMFDANFAAINIEF